MNILQTIKIVMIKYPKDNVTFNVDIGEYFLEFSFDYMFIRL